MASVTVRVEVPHQVFEFEYDAEEWADAVARGEEDQLMDMDLCSLGIERDIYGPDGERI